MPRGVYICKTYCLNPYGDVKHCNSSIFSQSREEIAPYFAAEQVENTLESDFSNSVRTRRITQENSCSLDKCYHEELHSQRKRAQKNQQQELMFARNTSRNKNTIVVNIFDYLLCYIAILISEACYIKAQRSRPWRAENIGPLF